MVHAYHVVFGAFGFWLPNDPRGSCSETVTSWDLHHHGEAKGNYNLSSVEKPEQVSWLKSARKSLKHPAVRFNLEQIEAIACGIEQFVSSNKVTLWALSILPNHVHSVIARHRYEVEQICNLMKGRATAELSKRTLRPNSSTNGSSKPGPVWAEKQWLDFLEDDEGIENAISYVQENPIKAGMAAQHWSFVKPFPGIPNSGWLTYH